MSDPVDVESNMPDEIDGHSFFEDALWPRHAVNDNVKGPRQPPDHPAFKTYRPDPDPTLTDDQRPPYDPNARLDNIPGLIFEDPEARAPEALLLQPFLDNQFIAQPPERHQPEQRHAEPRPEWTIEDKFHHEGNARSQP